MDRRKRLGAEGENLALEYLRAKGLKFLARNHRTRLGELDLVMYDKTEVVFVEVRTKSSDSFGSGVESITYKKTAKLKQLAQQFLMVNNLQHAAVRFDVVAIYKPDVGVPKIEYIKGAF